MIDAEKKPGAGHHFEDVDDRQDVLAIDARLQTLVEESQPFYRKRNLFTLYLLMVPGCLVPALTLGFDGAMMNGLQAIKTWNECKSIARRWHTSMNPLLDNS